jgi:DNA-binding protein H-NS
MAIELNDLSAKELADLIQQAKKRQTILKKRKPIATIRAKINAFVASEGYTIEDLFGGRAAKTATKQAPAKKATRKGRKLGKVPPKYRNPANRTETWTGRGKQPRWMAALVKKGKKPEDFLIKK